MNGPSLEKRFHKHIWYYSVLLVMQGLGLVSLLLVAPNKPMQLSIILYTTGIYVVWSLIHQFFHHTLTAKVAAEYVLIGFFGIAISFFVF